MPDKKIALWILDTRALNLATRCADELAIQTIFAPKKQPGDRQDDRLRFFDRFQEELFLRFQEFDAHLFIMATGIVVRNIAELLKNKTTDPAVLVLDECGHHVISLIAGHLGGANALTVKLAAHLGAKPVITTATDTHNLTALDEVARKIGGTVENPKKIKTVSTCLINQVPVGLCCDRELFDAFYGHSQNSPDYIDDLSDVDVSHYGAFCIISEKYYELPSDLIEKKLFIRPPILTIGIGCNKNTAYDEIDAAVSLVLKNHRLSPLSVAGLATIVQKQEEPGLVEYARSYGHDLQAYSSAELNRVTADELSPPSPHSEKHVGARGVAEPAALLSAGSDAQLLVPKQKIRNVTVAVAKKQLSYSLNPKDSGKLFVVGIGPGDPIYMTDHVRRIIDTSKVIVGYKKYIELLTPLIDTQEIIATGMTREIERVDEALRAAVGGKIVALVCSGDAGIYGMAGLVYERQRHLGINVETEISPGVSAATAAASLLGAPLVNDFITLSLSDLLTPTETVEMRIRLAATSDMVTAVYNPVSKKRKALIAQLQAEFIKHRDPDTPVGVVTHALRKGQNIQFYSLRDLLHCEMNMNSVVIIGNSETEIINERMVTRRGYQRKQSIQGP